MTDRRTPDALPDAALDMAQGGNLIDTFPTSVRGADRRTGKGVLFFDEADAVADTKPGAVFEPNDKN